MKKILFFSLLIFTKNAFAQKGLREMINAEKHFAAYAVANSTKEAFVKFADTGAVMFSKGEPVNGYQLWVKREKSPGVLNWRPRYAEIAASGDFGYTCGPWTFHPKTIKDPVAANGLFFTVWQKNKAGDWKFILDVGTESGPMMKEISVLTPSVERKKGSLSTMLAAETEFIALHQTDTVKAYNRFLSSETIIAREGSTFSNNIYFLKPGKSTAPGQIQFMVQGSGIAPSDDLGYVYGTATFNDKKETYLRIWRHERTGWKIALQMIR